VNALLYRSSLDRIGVVVEDAFMEVAVAHMTQDAGKETEVIELAFRHLCRTR
jgi:hypothetical protein